VNHRLCPQRLSAGWTASLALISITLVAGTGTAIAADSSPSTDERITQLSDEVAELKALVHQLQEQVARQAAASNSPVVAVAAVPAPTSAPATAAPSATAPGSGPGMAAAVVAAPPSATVSEPATATAAAGPAAPAATAVPKVAADILRGITINAALDGYYEYNTNNPIGRVNYLRAYDVSSNSFSLNQADLVIESATDVAAGKRYGMRLDLQYGQATETLQGSPVNELRPDVYRSVYQAYGTYVFPLGSGLTLDFGKWASSLGMEGNYTKDQLNYSRSWWFNYLPYYHMGARAKYAVNDLVTVNAYVANGAQQTEANNNYKDQMLGLVITPNSKVSWTVNFYEGQEHPDVIYLSSPGPGQQNLPQVQGTYIQPITNPPTGKLYIGDTYASWQVTSALTLGAEADDVSEKLYSYSSPEHVSGGALYAGYQISPLFAVATRAEYLADRGGLFSGTTQYLKEETLTFDYRPADGFLMRAEYRRDLSNKPYFLGSSLGQLETAQPTIGVGLVWWIGQKTGSW